MMLLRKTRPVSTARAWLAHSRVRLALPTAFSAFSTASTTAGPDVPPRAPYDVLFCGTDAFAASSLAALISQRELYSSLHVLTPADAGQKWGARRMRVSPVKQLALEHSLPHQQVPAVEDGGMAAYTLPSDLPLSRSSILLTCSFGHLIPDLLLDAFPQPWQRINIHPSLLPQLRGAAPIQWALARRLTRSGVSIQTLEKGKFDTGRIIAQTAFDFPPLKDAGFLEVQDAMAERAARLLVQTLSDLPTYWANSWEQDEAQRSLAPKLKSTHSVVQWSRMQAADIVARNNAFSYLYPLSTTLHPAVEGTSFRPVEVTLSDVAAIAHADLDAVDPAAAQAMHDEATKPGCALLSSALSALVVKTKASNPPHHLLVRTLKAAGKKPKRAQEWYAAYHDRAHPTTRMLTLA